MRPGSFNSDGRPTMQQFQFDGVGLIQISPFIGSAVIVVKAVRAIIKGEVAAGQRYRRSLSRIGTPVAFWFEMALHAALAGLLFLFGLGLIGRAPRWFVELMK